MIKKILGAFAVLALLYGAAWVGAAFWLRAAVDGYVHSLESQGYAITRGESQFAGFPAQVGLKLPALSVAAPRALGGWRWEADNAVIGLRPSAPFDPIIDLSGGHRIFGFLSAPEEGFALSAGHGLAKLGFDGEGALENIVLMLTATTVSDLRTQATLLQLGDSSLQIAFASGHGTLAATEITLPKPVPGLGPTIKRLDLAVDVTGRLAAGPLRQSLEAWRDGGGAIEIRSLMLEWPPATVAGSGTLALDAALQPMGAATFKFQGFFDIVDALTKAGHVHEREASVAKVVLGMLAQPSAGGAPELSLPLTVQDRKLHAGPVMLMETPAVVWDESARVP